MNTKQADREAAVMNKGRGAFALLVTVCALLLAAGCSNIFIEKPQSPELSLPDIPEGFGTVQISLSRGEARTVAPDPVELNTLQVEYWLVKDGGTAEQKQPADGKFVLDAGSYALTVKGFLNVEDPDTLAAQGDASFTITAGVDAGTVNVTLRPVVTGTGTGSLAFGLQYPAGATVEALTLTRIAGDEFFNLLDPLLAPTGTDPLVLSGTKDIIPVGYYLLRVVLRNSAGAAVGRSEAVHIYQNLTAETTLAGYTFSAADFSAYLVSNAHDSGAGSLRQALIDAPDGHTIRVMLEPGSVIALESAPQITKSLVIEGNGVTLTRAASWTTSPNSGGLLYITSATAEVKISGVHFKDGRVENSGGAIYATGLLTLESCVFSGNQGSYGGGAISSGNTLTIRGCTFYGNSAGSVYGGGAVYFSATGKTLTLTGNLFYGNTAPDYYPVVYCSSGTVSALYNIVDVAFGTGSAQCGWAQGTGDRLATTLPLSPKTFRMLTGSVAGGVIASLPADYPARDFYGQAINANAAAGAVQASASGSGYYLELSVNNSAAGTVEVTPEPDEDGLVAGSIAITAHPDSGAGYSLRHWLVNGVQTTTNPLSLSEHAWVQAVFKRAVTVNTFTDGAGSATTPGTLRYALTNAGEGDVISFSGVTAGTTTIALASALPEITKTITIEGNGITLTRAVSWTDSPTDGGLLYINSTTAEVTISRVRFKDGRATAGGAIRAIGPLTLESCVFSGNQASYGGAIYSGNTLTIRGCTFYGNSADSYGGAVCFSVTGKTLILTGNLFYGNTVADYYLVVYRYGGTISASYNVVDVAFGTGSAQCGWEQGTGEKLTTTLPLSPKTFRMLMGSGAGGVIASLPADYPATDFYGQAINANAAAGAVQASTSGYYLELSVNNSMAGTVEVTPEPDEDGIVPVSVVITANPNSGSGYSLRHWLVNGVQKTTNPLSLSEHAWVQAVFKRAVTVNTFTDGAGSATTPGTLRYALTNAGEGDVISFSGVTAGTTTIALASALPEITKTITIEGNGITLTRAVSWKDSPTYGGLLYINSTTAEVKISGVRFKDGRVAGGGGAISTTGPLTLESCVFSGNQSTIGGAIYSGNTLTIRGCTFYGNAGPYGGAVYFAAPGKTLTLTGNLFYGNTARTSDPVVYCGVSGTVSASYNVVDVAFGAESAQCGWAQGTGEKLATTLLLSGKTFKLLSGSDAGSVIASLPADYPARDFYGQAINANAAAGAVQASTSGSGYYLELSVNNSAAGTVEVSPEPDEDGLFPAAIAITAHPNSGAGYSLGYWLVNGVQSASAPVSLSDHTVVQAVFKRTVTVNAFTDGAGSATTPGTLRYALTNAGAGDVISFSGVTAGTTTIALASALPQITKTITIEGNGITLTRAASWTDSPSYGGLLYINSTTAEVKISGVRFKDGQTIGAGGAIRAIGPLTLESCVFSGNQGTRYGYGGGAIDSVNTLTIRGCTFYGNSADSGGAVHFSASGKTLTLTGNLFYGNTAYRNCPVVYSNGTVSASYNIVDVAFGTGSAQCGWAQGTGDRLATTLPLSPKTFRMLTGSEAGGVIASLPADYPATDFYGQAINANAAAGAVQASTSGYYLELSVNNSMAGTVDVSPEPDEDGLFSGSITITAHPNSGSGYSLGYWLVNGVQSASAPGSLSGHTVVQAVFKRTVTVNTFTDGAGSATTPGTLRYALTNARDLDIISFSGVTAGTTTIELASALPQITKTITIEGNGVTLTRAASWTDIDMFSQLLYINSTTAEVKISGVRFKDGRATELGGAIRTIGPLILESCVFSGNRATIYGGAIMSLNTLTIRGCTFYENSAEYFGGAVYFRASDKTLTLTGNLFYGNTAPDYYPVVSCESGTVSALYNIVDVAFGTGSAQCGWAQGTGDRLATTLPLSPKTLRMLTGSVAGGVIASLPADYPATDFYGQAINANAAAGAVQASTSGSGYYLELSVNNSAAGTVEVTPEPDEDGIVPVSVVITANPNSGSGYSLRHWLVNGVQSASAPASLSEHAWVQAVFQRTVTVNNFTGGTGSATTPGTLRYALTNAGEGDVISFSGVTAGTTTIELASALPEITKTITIEGNGVTLTRAVSWTDSPASGGLLNITSAVAEVKISGVCFKDGWATSNGGAIRTIGPLTLESCVFSGNQTISSGRGAIMSLNTLTIRGCTFYGNSVGSDGAVYFSATGKTLTLTGNLFYGNTAPYYPYYPVVSCSDGTINASYNIVDVAFGTGNAKCGWAQGTGDMRITTGNPINTTSFRPNAGSPGITDIGIVPAGLAGFPTTDFYGNTRTFPNGAAGAVAFP